MKTHEHINTLRARRRSLLETARACANGNPQIGDPVCFRDPVVGPDFVDIGIAIDKTGDDEIVVQMSMTGKPRRRIPVNWIVGSISEDLAVTYFAVKGALRELIRSNRAAAKRADRLYLQEKIHDQIASLLPDEKLVIAGSWIARSKYKSGTYVVRTHDVPGMYEIAFGDRRRLASADAIAKMLSRYTYFTIRFEKHKPDF